MLTMPALEESAMLLTGFESYGGRSLNPAEQVVKRLDGAEIRGVRVNGRTLPVDYQGLGPRIIRLIEEIQPRAVICLGLWPGTPMLRFERIAVNIADFEIPDNVGHMTRGPVVEGGAEAYASTLPIHAIQDRLLEAGIPARLSASAGTFLCNALMYHALGASAGRMPAAPCGFIHLPYMPELVSMLLLQMRESVKVELHQRADLASMALEIQIEAIRIAIETTLDATSS
jgi:pyroglutamyl-peptidase